MKIEREKQKQERLRAETDRSSSNSTTLGALAEIYKQLFKSLQKKPLFCLCCCKQRFRGKSRYLSDKYTDIILLDKFLFLITLGLKYAYNGHIGLYEYMNAGSKYIKVSKLA